MNGIDREKRLARLRENSRRYYEAHKKEIVERRKEAHKASCQRQNETGTDACATQHDTAERRCRYLCTHETHLKPTEQ